MKELDIFTKKRLERFIQNHRTKTGQLPTLRDFDDHGFDRDLIEKAIRFKVIEEFYVTLSNGSIVKGYKITQLA